MDACDPVVIRDADPAEADAILVLRVTIPNLVTDDADHYPLKLAPKTGATESVEHCSHADGRLPDGRVFGYGKTVSIESRGVDALIVRLSLYWTARDGTRGDAEDELLVPWLGTAEKDLGDGVRVSAAITPRP